MQVTARSLIIVLSALIIVLFAVGVLQYKKDDYGCYPSDSLKFRWGEKIEVFKAGSFHVYTYPLIRDCPEEDRYDPATIKDCTGNCYYNNVIDEDGEIQ